MMTPERLIGHAKDRGIELSVTPDFELSVSAYSRILTMEAVDFLRQNKEPIVDKLCDFQFQAEVFRIMYPDDIAFVVKQVRHVFGRKRLDIVRSYLEEFDAGYEAEPNPVKKRNAARYRANAWIKEEKFNQPTTTDKGKRE